MWNYNKHYNQRVDQDDVPYLVQSAMTMPSRHQIELILCDGCMFYLAFDDIKLLADYRFLGKNREELQERGTWDLYVDDFNKDMYRVAEEFVQEHFKTIFHPPQPDIDEKAPPPRERSLRLRELLNLNKLYGGKA